MNIKFKAISLLLFISCSVFAQKTAKVFYVKIEKGQSIEAKPIKEHQQKETDKTGQKIVIYPDIEFQTMEGIGGAFNENGGEALASLREEKQAEVMKNLFGKDGAEFTFCRTAIGASDFGLSAYSYSETPEDYDMKHFSVKREEKTVIPYIQKAIKYNPDLKIFASPWSPPGWMKYSGVMDAGDGTKIKNRLKEEPRIFKAYALYFSKYVKAYAKEGIKIHRIIIQNENDSDVGFPSCIMPPKQMAEFASKYLRPSFQKHTINSEIWAGTFRTADVADAIEFVNNKTYLDAVDGIGIQYTKSRLISDMLTLAPKVKFMHTEGVCHRGENSVEQAFRRLAEIAGYVNFGSPNYCYWNMILNETSTSGWNWKQNSLIVIDRKAKKVTYTPDYSVIALLSKYLQPGTKRIANNSRATVISVKSEDKIYLAVQNPGNEDKIFSCFIQGKNEANVEIPSNSVAIIELENK